MREGYKTYAELLRENEEKFKSEYRKYFEEEEAKKKSEQGIKIGYNQAKQLGLGQNYASKDLSQLILNTDYGTSKYDRLVTSVSDLENLNEFRASNQSIGDKIGNSLVNAGIIAGTTILDGWGGIPIGILNMVGAAAKGEDWTSIRAAYTNNPWSKFLLNIQEEYSLPVYKSSLYENASNVAKLTDSTFWTDSIIKNAGYLVGAYVGGAGVGKVASKIMKLDKALDMFKGAAVSAGKANKADNAVDLLKRYCSGDANVTRDVVEEALVKTAKNIRNRQWGVRVASLYIASDGEARIESIGSAKLYFENLDGLASQVLSESTSEEYLILRIFNEHPEWFNIQLLNPEAVGIEGIKIPNIKPEYIQNVQELKDLYKKEAKAKYAQYSTKLKSDYNDYLNTVYTANLALLLATNGGLTKNAATAGFSKASKMNVSYGGKFGKSATNAGAMELAGISTGTKIWEKAKLIGSTAMEGILEGGLGAITRAADAYYGLRINTFYELALNAEGLKAHASFLGDLAASLGETITNPKHWEEALTGFITAAIPFTGGKMRKVVQEDGTIKKEFRFNSGLLADILEFVDSKKATNKYIQVYNEFANDPDKKRYVEAILRNYYYNNIQEGALENFDKNEYKNAEFDKLINMAMLFHSNGRIQAFKESIENLYSIESELDIEDLKGILLTEDGKSIFDGMSSEQIFKYYKNTKQDILNTIDKVGSIYDNLNQIWGSLRSTEFLQELAYDVLNIDNRETRIKDIVNKISKIVQSDREQLEKAGIDMSSLNTTINDINSLSVFFEEGEAELLDQKLKEGYKLELLAEEKRNLIEILRSEGFSLPKEKKEYLASLVSEYQNLTSKETLTEEEKNKLEEVVSKLDKENKILGKKVYDSYPISVLKGLLTKYKNQNQKSPDASLETKIKNIEKALNKRERGINKAIKDLGKLNRVLNNLHLLEITTKDVLDLVRLLSQRELFVQKLNSLLENPENFEKLQSEILLKSYNSYIDNKVKQCLEEFKRTKNPLVVPKNYVEKVINYLEEEGNLKLLILILERFKSYTSIMNKIIQENDKYPDIIEISELILHVIATSLSKSSGISAKDINEDVKKYLTQYKEYLNKINTEEARTIIPIVDKILQKADYGLEVKKPKKKEKHSERRINPAEVSEELDEEDFEEEENVDEDGVIMEDEEETVEGDEEESEKVIKKKKEKTKKSSKKSKADKIIDEENIKDEEEDVEESSNFTETKVIKKETIESKVSKEDLPKNSITAEGQKTPLKEANKELPLEELYDEDEIVNVTGKHYDLGENYTEDRDDSNIDAFHVGRVHYKYSITELKNRKATLAGRSMVAEFLEERGAYDFMDRGGMAAVIDYYEKKKKQKVPVLFMTTPYKSIPKNISEEKKKQLYDYNGALLAVTKVPKGTKTPEGIKPAFKDKKYDYYIIGAIKSPSKELNTSTYNNYKNIKNKIWAKNDDNTIDNTYFEYKNIGNKQKVRISKFNTTLSWVYSGRLTANKDENGNNIERNLADVLTGLELALVDKNKPNFSIVIHRGIYSPIYIGKEYIPESKIVGLNRFRTNTKEGDSALSRAGTIWILHQESDGKYYHKAVKVKKFTKDYLEEESDNENNEYIKGIKEAASEIKLASNVEEYKEALKLLRNYIYFPNSNLYIKDDILYITKGSKSSSINLKDFTEDEILEALSEFNFKFTFNGNTTLKTIIYSNILTTDLDRLNNIGASAIINMVDASDMYDIKILESLTVQNWIEEDTIHTGESEQKSNVRTYISFNNEGYYRTTDSESGNIVYYQIIDGVLSLVENNEENESLLESLEFLYYKNLKFKNKQSIHTEVYAKLGKLVNKYTVYALIKPYPNRDDVITYFYKDGTKLSEEAVKIVNNVKRSIIGVSIEHSEESKERLVKAKEKLYKIYKFLHNEDYSEGLKMHLYDVINAIENILNNSESNDYFTNLTKLGELLNKSTSTLSANLQDIFEEFGDEYIDIDSLYNNSNLAKTILKLLEETIDTELGYKEILQDIIDQLPLDSEFNNMSLNDLYNYIKPLIGYADYLYNNEEIEEDEYLEDEEELDEEYSNEENDESSDAENNESEDNDTTESTKIFTGFGVMERGSDNMLNDENEDILEEFIESLNDMNKKSIISNIEKQKLPQLQSLNLNTDNGIKEAIRIMFREEDNHSLDFMDYLDNLQNECK